MNNLMQLLEELPPEFGRKAIDSIMPGVIRAKTLANLESLGKGPNSHKIGRTVFYQRDEFVEWFIKHMQH